MRSIFEPRQNINFDERFTKLTEFLTDLNFVNGDILLRFFDFVELTFNEWPHKNLSFDLKDYFNQLDINIDTIWSREILNDEKFLIIEFVYNYSKWLLESAQNPGIMMVRAFWSLKVTLASDNSVNLRRVCDFIEKLLNLENYNIVCSNEEKKYLIIINDLEIATINPTPENATILDLIYSYLEFKNKSVSSKEAILSRIYIYLENHDDEFHINGSKQLFTDVRNVMNKTNIRHGGDGIKDFTDEEKIEIYDKCFKMSVHLIKTPEINKYQKEIKALSN